MKTKVSPQTVRRSVAYRLGAAPTQGMCLVTIQRTSATEKECAPAVSKSRVSL